MAKSNKMSNDEVIKISQQKLQENRDDWMTRFKGYADDIEGNDRLRSIRNRFHSWEPLKFYLATVDVGNTRTLYLSVRYLGQQVATLSCGYAANMAPILDTSDFDETNERDFNCNCKVKQQPWVSSEAKEFRKHFLKNPKRNNKSPKNNEEHRLESLLISEFSKPDSEKLLPRIQPVKLDHYYRYPMPTAISASNHKNIHYGISNIDIMARVKRGNKSHLCIIELKDENKSKESPSVVIQQAIAYATFIHELLRSDIGERWWKIFGFRKPIPDQLTLFASIAMPSNNNNDHSFAGNELEIGDKDKIKLQYIYFKEENNVLKEIDASWLKKS